MLYIFLLFLNYQKIIIRNSINEKNNFKKSRFKKYIYWTSFFCKATYLIDGMAGSYAKLYWKNSENEAIREFICFTWSSNQAITCSIYLQ
jgi:hypothetical protein